ncbi:hypothetical protein [Streptomyces qinzhouensis]|uniref:Uncharacterized protein n=1 Tax=Streptomyces qinzhouensis TaxID=2599401 RepID=A0A5B8J4F5_9ACTN|nr:hypothetical protein [Streptomyces qinzhouensis]QDY75254.1 hypothetical protein FQU76_00685 [Streptomyces qinzhouensis]
MITLLVRLYPRRFRAAYGDEVAAVYQELTADAGPVERLREAGGIAAHAVRLRLGLGSVQGPGRLCALAAPLVLAVSAAEAVRRLAETARYAITMRAEGRPPMFFPTDMVLAAACAALVAAAVVALSGRWTAGRLWAAAAQSGYAVTVATSGHNLAYTAGAVGTSALTVAVLLACPPDEHPEPRLRLLAAGAGAATAIPLAALALDLLPVTTDYGLWPFLVLALTAGLLALHRGRPVPALAASALASVPFFDAAFGWHSPVGPAFAPGLLLLTVTGAALCLAARTLLPGRARSSRPGR